MLAKRFKNNAAISIEQYICSKGSVTHLMTKDNTRCGFLLFLDLSEFYAYTKYGSLSFLI